VRPADPREVICAFRAVCRVKFGGRRGSMGHSGLRGAASNAVRPRPPPRPRSPSTRAWLPRRLRTRPRPPAAPTPATCPDP
jgi:hypothetical protein